MQCLGRVKVRYSVHLLTIRLRSKHSSSQKFRVWQMSSSSITSDHNDHSVGSVQLQAANGYLHVPYLSRFTLDSFFTHDDQRHQGNLQFDTFPLTRQLESLDLRVGLTQTG